MNRRGFLGLLGGIAAAAVAPAIILPERRIWQVSRHAPVPSRFYGARDILAASGGSLFGVDPGCGAKGFVWARWDDEGKALVMDEIDQAEVFADARRIGKTDLTFERPSEETLRLWRENRGATAGGTLTREKVMSIDTPSLRMFSKQSLPDQASFVWGRYDEATGTVRYEDVPHVCALITGITGAKPA